MIQALILTLRRQRTVVDLNVDRDEWPLILIGDVYTRHRAVLLAAPLLLLLVARPKTAEDAFTRWAVIIGCLFVGSEKRT